MIATQTTLDLGAARHDFLSDVLEGLSRPRKRLASKYFYDQRGSQLFDRICELPEYYLTRTEMGLLREHCDEMAELVGERATLVELGSGSSIKVRLLLDALERPAAYVPIDISREHLLEAAEKLAASYPEIDVLPVWADYTQRVELPREVPAERRVAFFPGSTIGNFTPPEATRFLAETARTVGAGCSMIVGVDLIKDTQVLQAAYDDVDGVTAEFNINLLRRINLELGADFDLDGFAHRAVFNPDRSCIEMHLVSARSQRVQVGGRTFGFAGGETIHTEDSHKYRLDQFASMARSAGWEPRRTWVDAGGLFSIHFLRTTG